MDASIVAVLVTFVSLLISLLDKLSPHIVRLFQSNVERIVAANEAEIQKAEFATETNEKHQTLGAEAQSFLQSIAQQQFDEMREKIASYEAKFSEMVEKLTTLTIDNNRLRSDLDRANKELSQLQIEFGIVTKSANLTEQKLKVAEENVRTLSARAERLSEQINGLEREIQRLEASLTDEKLTNRELREQARRLQDEISALREREKEHLEQIEELTRLLADCYDNKDEELSGE